MFATKARPHHDDFFVSAKTSTAIPAGCAALHDALVIATLDPAVRSIGFVATAVVAAQTVAVGAVVLRRDDGMFRLDVVAARPQRGVEQRRTIDAAIDALALPPLTVTTDEIHRPPRYANARLVWRYRNAPVGIAMRMQILRRLSDDGPMTFGQLLGSMAADRDPAPAVMALVCSDLIEIDLLSGPLGPDSMLRSRS